LGGKVEGKTLEVASKCREMYLFFGDKRRGTLELKTLRSGQYGKGVRGESKP
jgi:hypothetical protein